MINKTRDEGEITIKVDEKGLTVEPNVLRIQSNNGKGKIKFVMGQNISVLTIQFKGISPLEPACLVNPPREWFNVRPDAQPGTYSYAVAVEYEGEIYLDAATPGIIVDRP